MSRSDYTEFIARISMGKDSLKMLDVIWTRGLPLDRITTTDVWATETIPAYLPPMQEFRDRMDDWIWTKYRIECEHLCAMNTDGTKKTYEQMFYHIPNRRSQTVQVERERERETGSGPTRSSDSRTFATRGVKLDSSGTPLTKLQGTIKGFPLSNGELPWCQHLKTRVCEDTRISGHNIPMVSKAQDRLCPNPFLNERPTRRRKRNIVEYLGIAADEPDRHGQLNERKRAPLVEFGIDEDLCGLYCQYNNILAPSYETSCRDGCWFCHNQGVDQLRNLWRNYPDHWALLLKWDKDSPVTFKADGHTVHDFDRRFQMEEDGLVPMDKTFRWAPVESYISIFDILRGET